MPDRKPRAPRPVKAWAVMTTTGKIVGMRNGNSMLATDKETLEPWFDARQGHTMVRVLIVPEPRDE